MWRKICNHGAGTLGFSVSSGSRLSMPMVFGTPITYPSTTPVITISYGGLPLPVA